MRKKRFTKQTNVNFKDSDVVRISEEVGQYFFEVGSEITTDLAEAVAIMMRNPRTDNSIWSKKIQINYETIEPQKALYWLSGGDNEWITLQNYNQPWNKCYLEFQEEFGFIVINILKKSKNLGDIRNGFQKYLNLPNLYEFALSKNLIR
jgi:hypothetical protein